MDMEQISVNPLRLRDDLHLVRKLWHVGTGFTGLMIHHAFGLETQATGRILLVVAGLAFLFELTRLKYESINQMVLVFMKPFMRESERNSISGLPFYALGVALSLLLFPGKIAILSVLFLMFADPISSCFGILYGQTKILPNKSLEGTVAGFLTCYLITLFYGLNYTTAGPNLLLFALVAGVIGAFSELLSIFVDDNLTVPLFSGLGLTGLNFVFHIF